ncbi:hypothetical protein TSACC_141 [Terrimicrobium sacchariphilum]|uniref:DUF2164 domain-containing protein n=1 Tax=Terrimicrobium sacchariphilum TaxID=690879 RepID=A0A146G1U5_TERSA|nr:DUF2164 domain-containing protein [Terrimicrobium sacchariphilum]GAT31493.1 hypothetical protein TSACC_141 [Terrimicrobium sacchariphilum]
MPVQLSKEAEKEMTSSLQEFLSTELELEVGNLQTGLLLRFFLSEIAPTVYNQAISDAGRYLLGAMTELPAVCFEPEYQYSERKKERRGKRG